ncbi:hypothetical protein, partial [Streptomyces sp. DH7]|uniref:hypothetical protein n=1 Tax=Streptomyces sp. DH7 TaxID=2857006 RepID=UPI001E28C366
EYSSDLYDAPTVQALFNRLVRLLDAVTAQPDQPLSRIDLLTAEERNRTIVEVNRTELPLPDALLAELFEQQVTLTPDAPALVSDGATLSYSELNTRANHLAHQLT